MSQEELDLVAQAGVGKYTVSKREPVRYLVRGMMAGFYLALGTFSNYILLALFYSTNPALGRVLGAFAFGLGLVSIVMLGGDLFTGTAFVMCVSTLEKKTTWGGTLRVWVMSYLGNIIGSVIIVSIFALGGSMNGVLTDYVTTSVATKLSLPIGEMIFRGILCNFSVCAAVLAGMKIKDATAKIMVIMLLIFSFILAGYEHCVANMGFFTLAYYLVPGVDTLLVLRSMLWVTLGNILGGAVMLGLPYWYIGKQRAGAH